MASKWGKVKLKSVADQMDRKNQPVSYFYDLLENPCSRNYAIVVSKLENSTTTFINEFLDCGALFLVFDSIFDLNTKRNLRFCDTVIIAQMVKCVKIVLNSAAGIDYIIEDGEMMNSLLLGMVIDGLNLGTVRYC